MESRISEPNEDNRKDENEVYIDGDAEVESISGEDPSEFFDPKLIDIRHKVLSLDALIRRIENDEVNLETDFQRNADLWTKKQQSRLIESILINFPLPIFYFDGSDDNKWLVVDGLQRLSAIKNFVVSKTLQLKGLEFLSDLNNKIYDDLSSAQKRHIQETQIISYIIHPGTPPAVKYRIYERINTGGLILRAQEIRHALNFGMASQLLKEMAEIESFKAATQAKVSPKRMLDREYVNRFIAFYLTNYTEYKGDLNLFLNDSLALLKKKSPEEIQQMKATFEAALQTLIHLFGNKAFRRAENKPVSITLFEVWTASLASLSPDQLATLKNLNPDTFYKRYLEWIAADKDGKNFNEATERATGDTSKVKARHKNLRQFILKQIL